RKVTLTVLVPGASMIAAPVPWAFSSAIKSSDNPLTLDLGFRDGMRSGWAFSDIGRHYRLAFQGRADGAVHHQFGQMHGCLVEHFHSGANLLIVVAGHYRLERVLQLANVIAFAPSELLPGEAAAGFLERGKNRVGFVAGFDDLALGEILLGV